MVTFPCCSSVKMPFPESGCVIAGDYLLIECVGIAAVQMRSVQSNSIYWTWLVAIGWAACVAPAQVGSRASMQWNASLGDLVTRLVGETVVKADAGIWPCTALMCDLCGQGTGPWCMYDVFFACVVAIWVRRLEFAVCADVCRVVVNSFDIVFDLHTYILIIDIWHRMFMNIGHSRRRYLSINNDSNYLVHNCNISEFDYLSWM